MYHPRTFFDFFELGLIDALKQIGVPNLSLEQMIENACRWPVHDPTVYDRWSLGDSSPYQRFSDARVERVERSVRFGENFITIYGSVVVTIAPEGLVSTLTCQPEIEINTSRNSLSVRVNSGEGRGYGLHLLHSPSALYYGGQTSWLPIRALIAMADALRPAAQDVSCWLTSPTARIVNVNEYANLRRQPDFAATVLRRLPLGEQVRVPRFDNITIVGQDRDRQSCINACQAFDRNPGDRAARDRAQQCINDNFVWYEITDARGNRGWVSRRFLQEVE
jgi:hypothetical protein